MAYSAFSGCLTLDMVRHFIIMIAHLLLCADSLVSVIVIPIDLIMTLLCMGIVLSATFVLIYLRLASLTMASAKGLTACSRLVIQPRFFQIRNSTIIIIIMMVAIIIRMIIVIIMIVIIIIIVPIVPIVMMIFIIL